ncbi:MAG: polyprenyl synthetase family protein [Micrococcales bacterium]
MSRLPRQFQKVQDKALLNAIEAGLELVEAELAIAVTNSDQIVDSASRHLLEAGGKRVRPVLVLLTAQLGDASREEVIKAAVVSELTHLATLYHDDVMDDAPTRRGVPTAQKVYGNSVAILAGDVLLARASQIGVDLGAESLKLQAETFERLCIGQLHETVGPQGDEDHLAHYIQVMADKTGSLLASSALMGVIHSGAPVEYRKPISQFAERIGIAFQLIDDVIDISAAGPSGKTPGTDLRAGVPTLPTLLLQKAADAGDSEAAELIRFIESGLEEDAKLEEALRRLREHPVAAQAEAEAKRWAASAVDAISVLPDSSVKRALEQFAEAVVNRDN